MDLRQLRRQVALDIQTILPNPGSRAYNQALGRLRDALDQGVGGFELIELLMEVMGKR